MNNLNRTMFALVFLLFILFNISSYGLVLFAVCSLHPCLMGILCTIPEDP